MRRNYLPIRERRRRVMSEYQTSIAYFAFLIGLIAFFMAFNLVFGLW